MRCGKPPHRPPGMAWQEWARAAAASLDRVLEHSRTLRGQLCGCRLLAEANSWMHRQQLSRLSRLTKEMVHARRALMAENAAA